MNRPLCPHGEPALLHCPECAQEKIERLCAFIRHKNIERDTTAREIDRLRCENKRLTDLFKIEDGELVIDRIIRERNEWQEANERACVRAEQAEDRAEKAERERDAERVRADAMRDGWSKDALSLERRLQRAMDEAESRKQAHDGQQRNTLEFQRELDEARTFITQIHDELSELRALELNHEGACVRLKRERDEALAQLKQGDNDHE